MEKLTKFTYLIIVVLALYSCNSNNRTLETNSNTFSTADTVNLYDMPHELTEEELLQNDIITLKNEIQTFDSISLEPFLTSVENIQLGIQYFEKIASDVKLAEQHSNNEINKYGEKLKNKLITKQKIWFPKFRKSYSNMMAEKVWENDVYVSVQGGGNTIFNLAGGIFAANKNIKEMQETIHSILYSLRFKQSRYRWYKGADEFTYYEINSKKDSEI